jgi:hypothetical protein
VVIGAHMACIVSGVQFFVYQQYYVRRRITRLSGLFIYIFHMLVGSLSSVTLLVDFETPKRKRFPFHRGKVVT